MLERGRGHAEVHATHWPAATDDAAAAPLQVCVHGLVGSYLNWSLVAPRLAAHGSVWVPDLAGFGRTLPAGRSATVEDNLDLLAGFIETVAPGRPAIVLGNSMGGHLAYSLAAARPDLVAGLVLVGPAVPPAFGRPDRQVAARLALLATPVVGRLWLEQRARQLTPAEQVREMLGLCAADPDCVDPELVDAHAELTAFRRLTPHAYAAYLDAARSLIRRLGPGRARVWADIAAVQAPTLVLHGGRDRFVSRASVEQVLARRPDWAHHIYPDLGHVVMLEDAERVATDIAAWRSGIRLAAATS
jgi:pimeloyl-ACP methyl ester carboxylesterase